MAPGTCHYTHGGAVPVSLVATPPTAPTAGKGTLALHPEWEELRATGVPSRVVQEAFDRRQRRLSGAAWKAGCSGKGGCGEASWKAVSVR